MTLWNKAFLVSTVTAVLLFVTGCSTPSADELYATAQNAHTEAQQVLDSLKRKADPVALFTPVVAAYEQVAAEFPKSDEAEHSLFKAAELRASYLQDVRGAVGLYARHAETFPASNRAPTALFMVGYLYNNHLLMADSAGAAYRKFLALYPQHELATSAQFELESLGKQPEELIPAERPGSVAATPAKKAPPQH